MTFFNIIGATLLFFFLVTTGTFLLMTTQETIGENLINEFANQSSELMLNNSKVQGNISSLSIKYDDAKFDYDNVFLVAWIILEVSIIGLAIKSPKIPQWSFMTLLFFGTIMLTFVYSFIMEITSWFLQEFILDLYSSSVTYMPFYSFYSNWALFIFVINIVGALVINNVWGQGTGTIPKNPFLEGS